MSTDHVPHIRHFTNVLIQSSPSLKGESTVPKSQWKELKPRTYRVP